MLGQDPNTTTLGFPYNWGGAGDTVNVNPTGGGNWWEGVLAAGAGTGFSILKDVFGGPRPGTYIQSREGMIYRMPEGQTGLNLSSMPPGFGIGGGMGTVLFWGALGLISLVVVSKVAAKS